MQSTEIQYGNFDLGSGEILGCSVVGDRAVDIVQVAAVAMAGAMDVETLANFQLSFPTYAGILGRAAAKLTYSIRHSDRS